MQDSRHHAVLDAATSQFIRYGFKRVTMGDIAEQAGLSRPALYLVFANKEAIFNSVLERFSAHALDEIRAGLRAEDTLDGKLRLALEVWVVRPFELLAATPDAREITDCTYGFAREVFATAQNAFQDLISATLEPYARALSANALTPSGAAHVFVASLKGLKESAADTAGLRQLIAALIAITVAACGGGRPARRATRHAEGKTAGSKRRRS